MIGARFILVPVRPSQPSSPALERARRLAASTGASIRLLSVRPARGAESWGGTEGRSSTEHFAAGVVGAAGSAEVVVAAGDPLRVILNEAARPDVDLVVMGQGRGGWRSWLRRALHELVIREARVPVLVVGRGGRDRGRMPVLPADVRARRRPLAAAGSGPALVVLPGGAPDELER